MTMLCLRFSLIAVKNIPSMLSLLYVKAYLPWMPDRGFAQNLTAKQAWLAPERSLQTCSFCLSCQQRNMASEELAGTHLCCIPGLSPVCSLFSSLLEQPQGCGGCLWTQQLPMKGYAVTTHSSQCPISGLPGCCSAGPGGLLPLQQKLPFLPALRSPPPTSLSQCSWRQFHYATFQSSWALCFHSPTFLSLSVFILLTPVPHSLHMACPSF